jgi:hypothetical protein
MFRIDRMGQKSNGGKEKKEKRKKAFWVLI